MKKKTYALPEKRRDRDTRSRDFGRKAEFTAAIESKRPRLKFWIGVYHSWHELGGKRRDYEERKGG
jgi:hypothetical protein